MQSRNIILVVFACLISSLASVPSQANNDASVAMQLLCTLVETSNERMKAEGWVGNWFKRVRIDNPYSLNPSVTESDGIGNGDWHPSDTYADVTQRFSAPDRAKINYKPDIFIASRNKRGYDSGAISHFESVKWLMIDVKNLRLEEKTAKLSLKEYINEFPSMYDEPRIDSHIHSMEYECVIFKKPDNVSEQKGEE